MGSRTLLTGKMIVESAEGESHDSDSGTFNYYGYIAPGGAWVIQREKDDTVATYRYKAGKSGFDTAWTNRSSHTYAKPNKITSFNNTW